jgi:hypothetical protein
MVTGTPRMVTDGLVLYFDAANVKSYPGSGTVWTDLSSTAITGSLTNGPIFSSANGGSIVFDGTNDYVNVTKNTTIQSSTNFSITGFFRTTSTTDYKTIYSDTTGSGATGAYRGYEIRLFSSKLEAGMYGNANGSYNYVSSSTTIATNTWYHFGVVGNSSGNLSIYINGILQQSQTVANSFVASENDISIGRYNVNSGGIGGYWSGNISTISIHNRALSSDEVLQNYESTRERFNLRGIAIDPDVSLFLRTAGITDTTQQSAIDTLVLEMKNAGIWSKMKAIYPFIGGTASSHKWNLKDPRDVDAAFRLTFTGGWTHSSTGALPNGTNAYADTFMIANPTISETSNHLSYYSRTIGSGTSTVRQDIGAADSPSYNSNILLAIRQSGVYYAISFTAANASMISNTNADSHGFYSNSRTSSTSHKAYKNGAQIGSTNTTVTSGYSSMTSARIYIGATSVSGTGINQYSDRECAFATIGDGLTDSEVSTLYTVVQKYQTTLGRQV